MEQSERGFLKTTAREFAVLSVAAVGAYLFFIHGALYGPNTDGARPLTLEGFLLVTTILYLFLRLIFVVAGLYYPRRVSRLEVCESCGNLLEETASPENAPTGHTSPSRHPTEREILAAVMLRKAIDDARRSSKRDLAGPRPEEVRVPGSVENAPVPLDEFERILRQLDTPRDMRYSGGRRPKGPT